MLGDANIKFPSLDISSPIFIEDLSNIDSLYVSPSTFIGELTDTVYINPPIYDGVLSDFDNSKEGNTPPIFLEIPQADTSKETSNIEGTDFRDSTKSTASKNTFRSVWLTQEIVDYVIKFTLDNNVYFDFINSVEWQDEMLTLSNQDLENKEYFNSLKKLIFFIKTIEIKKKKYNIKNGW